jgi:hypothetical protein
MTKGGKMLPLGKWWKVISDWFNPAPYEQAETVAKKRGRPKTKLKLWES